MSSIPLCSDPGSSKCRPSTIIADYVLFVLAEVCKSFYLLIWSGAEDCGLFIVQLAGKDQAAYEKVTY